jgi:hypothetical protein
MVIVPIWASEALVPQEARSQEPEENLWWLI